MTFLTEEIIKGTDWRAVERAVARLMSHAGWQSVRLVGGRGDKGGDVLGTRDKDGRKVGYVVQVKATMGGHYIGPSAVQEVVKALPVYHGDVGVVATNGDFTGTAYERRDALAKIGEQVVLWNGKFLHDLLDKLPARHRGWRELRPYQQEIVDLCLHKFDGGGTRAQFVVATGLGKTVIAAELLSRLYQRGLRRALVLCHTQDLALQLEQGFWPQLDKSIPTRVFFDGSLPKPYDGVNFGLFQTFSNYLSGVDPRDYDVVIVDEAHHAMAPAFLRCLQHLEPRFLVGMTATPWRGDMVSLDSLFGEPVRRVSLVDGMKMGYLARADYRIYCDTIDWEEVRRQTKGRVSITDLNRRLFVPQRDELIVDELRGACQEVREPRVIVFCASIEHCERFAGLLTATTPLVCQRLSGLGRVERNRVLMDFAAGRIQAVTAVDVLNEGIDVPDVNILVFLRATHSRRVFVQQLGRGLRLAPDKRKLLVLDFVTDVRRIAAVMEMDREARERARGEEYEVLYFEDGIVTLMNEGSLPFVQKWLEDVAALGDDNEARDLAFPEAS